MKTTARDILRDKGGHMVSISSEGTIYQALTLMTQNKVGSVVVVDNDKIVGIWTERDLMFRVLEEGFDPKKALLKDNMSEQLISVNINEQAYQMYDKFLGRRIRHLLVEEDGQYIGILSVGDVVRAQLHQLNEDYQELNQKVSLEYYENWKDIQNERRRPGNT
ncbi:MAG: CBS domain-containing protein [Pseudohongiellaceae bacterium]